MGWKSVRCVRIGNEMVSKLMLLAFIWISKGVFFVIEQPKGSLMDQHPRFQAFLRKFKIYRKYIAMADFGGETTKGSWLYSAHKFIHNLDDFKEPAPKSNHALVNKYVDKCGRTKIAGNKNLKLSQHYPDGFGRALVKLYRANQDARKSMAQRVTRTCCARRAACTLPARPQCSASVSYPRTPSRSKRLSWNAQLKLLECRTFPGRPLTDGTMHS